MRKLDVLLDFGGWVTPRRVGALIEEGPRLSFGYDAAFVAYPLPVSPVHLAIRPELYEHPDRAFERLPGLLFDAMPDGWGRLLQDRAFRGLGVSSDRITPLDRLAAVGHRGIGALTFVPSIDLNGVGGEASPYGVDAEWPIDLDAVASHTDRILEGSVDDVLPELMVAGGSPGGARPKVLVAVCFGQSGESHIIAGPAADGATSGALPPDHAPWIIKFPTRDDGPEAGAVEEAYARMARRAGIDLPLTHLFSTRTGRRFFGIQRFDRTGPGGVQRLHQHTMGGLLHADYRIPSCDYRQYVELTTFLTRDMRAVREAVRRMAFNVLAHNRDDHARNFAFLMDASGAWRISPAYDLTYTDGPNGHHTTSVDGEDFRPTMRHLLAVADHAGFSEKEGRLIIAQVEEAMSMWPSIAREVGVSRPVSEQIGHVIDATRQVVTGP